jgi:hypothetical protein
VRQTRVGVPLRLQVTLIAWVPTFSILIAMQLKSAPLGVYDPML